MRADMKNTSESKHASESHKSRVSRRTLVGKVVSDKMDKTVVVEVSRRVLDKQFGKYLNRKAKYKAHSELNQAKVGDKILIVETHPISKEKRWRVQGILESAQNTQ